MSKALVGWSRIYQGCLLIRSNYEKKRPDPRKSTRTLKHLLACPFGPLSKISSSPGPQDNSNFCALRD